MAALLRLKRKACDEPADGLLIALKKSKSDLSSNVNEVLFKFAATVTSEKECIKGHIQAALSKERDLKYSKWRDPKNIALGQRKVQHICEKLKSELKASNAKKRLDLLNNRRLIFTETVPVEENSTSQDTEVRKLFQLYDIIEENEEVKKQVDETENTITCNGEPLIRERSGDYVFDVYIADGHIDETFVLSTVSVRPCSLTADDIYSGDSDSSEDCYEDEDDSNDENNWRNDYPEDEDSNSEKDPESESDHCLPFDDKMSHHLQQFHIDDEDSDSSEIEPFDYSRIMQELADESVNS